MNRVSFRGPYSRFVFLNNRAVAVILLALALGAGAVFAGGRTLWQDGGVQLCGPSASTPMTAVTDSAGGAIAVWSDTRTWPEGIYAQRVDAAGVTQWVEDGVLLGDSMREGYRCVVDDGEHGAIAAWSYFWDGDGLAAQRVRADGVPCWGSNGLALRPPRINFHVLPALARDGHGGAIVVWTTSPVFGPADTLLACRVDSNGSRLWETVLQIDTLGDTPPHVCSDDLGGVIVAWSEGYSGPVRVQRVDSAGVVRWGSSGVLACTLSVPQGQRGCVPVGESRFVVGWFGGGGSAAQHRAQMFDLAGNRLWELAGVPISGVFNSTSSAIGLPADAAGQSLWLWSENRIGTKALFAQKLGTAGVRCWDSTGVWLGSVDTSVGEFSATVDGRGGAIATWTLYRNTDWDVYGQHVDSTGRLCWGDTGLAVCPGPTNVASPVAVYDSSGGAIVSWKDDRGLFAQRVADGPDAVEAPYVEVRAMSHSPTVVRDLLFLSEASSRKLQAASLLDISGRKAVDLHAGSNDVRALEPGVYFVRIAQAQARVRPVQKIVIAR